MTSELRSELVREVTHLGSPRLVSKVSSWGSDLTVCCPGVWGSTVVSEELHKTVGQNLYMKCQYKPEAGPYVPKSWCRQISSDRCNRVVTTSQTRRAETESQHAIWDYPEDGHFIITIARLTEKNSAIYWCGLFNVSHNTIRVLRNISLVVSPSEGEILLLGTK